MRYNLKLEGELKSMKTNKSMSRIERMHREKVTRYSIRKYSFGAASVAVAALFMFLGNGAVSAEMTAVQPQGEPELKAKPNDENTGSDKGQGNTTKQVDNTVVAETIAKPEEPATPALDKTKLEKYIKEIEAKFDKGAYANKTEESVALLKAELAAAKEVLQNATTQAELTKAYSKLATVANTKLVTKPTEKKVTPEVDTTNGQPTVGKKAGNTEPKAGTNSIANTGSHDPRNGKAMDRTNPLRTGEQPASTPTTDDSYNSFVFSGNDTDFKNHSTLEWFSKEGDGNNRNNASLKYGEDSHGKYVEWKSTQPRGGGFKLTIDKELGEEYTIGVKFAFDQTTGGWRKIVDYKNSADDTGFYFNKGRLQFYNDISSPLGTNPVPDNTVVDFIIVKSREKFAVYLVKDGKVTTEMSLTDPATLANTKPYTENGKTIFGFFFDDTSTSSEATSGGRVYRMSIYDKAIDPTKVVEKLNKKLDDSKYEPELKNPLPDVKKGSTPNAEDFIKNTPTSDELNKLPANTKITWGEAPDTSSEGLKPAVILVTYPDGSSDRVGVEVKVVATEKPDAPTVAADEATATVTVTPTGDVDKVKVTYTPTGGTTEKTIEIVKEAGGWKEKSATPTSGVSVNPTTGVVTLDHTVAEDGTAVKAVATKGNSDESAPGTATDPVKQATPAAPTVDVNKGKLELAIHRLDDFINHQSDKLDENSAKKAKALLEEGKKVFADSKASQDEVDTMVKRIEDFISEVSPTSNQANPANNQATQTSAVTPATVDAVSNQATTNARQLAKELPNTGTADSTVAMVAAAASALLGLGLAGRRRKEDEEA